jgi:hypothetical protein
MIMPETAPKKSLAKSKVAKQKPRDSHGHFIKISSNPSNSSNIPNPTERDMQKDKTGSNAEFINPLRRIMLILKQIKHHQSTIIDLKSIPVLVLFLLAALYLMRGLIFSSCEQGIHTKIGIVYILKTTTGNRHGLLSELQKFFITPLFSVISQGYFKQYQPNEDRSVFAQEKQRVILILRDNSVLTLFPAQNIDLSSYVSRQVFATGNFNSCRQTLVLKHPDDIQLVP